MPGAWPGFSFALHLLRVQGFYFALLQCSPIQAFTADFASFMQLYHPRYKTVHRALQGLFLLFAVFCRCRVSGASSYTAPPAPRWDVSQRRSTSSAHQIPAPRRDAVQLSTAAYYNKVYKGAGVQQIADRASPEGSRCFPRLALAWHRVSLALCFLPGTAARNHWQLSPQLFSGFRTIANRSQQ